MSIRLTVNATAVFESLEAARAAGIATETLLATATHTAGGVQLFDFATRRDVSLHQPVVDRSKWVQGRQEATDKLNRYVTELEKHADEFIRSADEITPPVDHWQPLFDSAHATGQINLAALTRLVGERFGIDDAAAVNVTAGVIASVNAAIAEREFRTALAPKKVR